MCNLHKRGEPLSQFIAHHISSKAETAETFAGPVSLAYHYSP